MKKEQIHNRLLSHSMGERKQYTIGTTISQTDYKWIIEMIEQGKAINQADLLRMALRAYMEAEKEKEIQRQIRLRQLENES